MSYRIIFTPGARADAIEAFRWIAGRSPDAAARRNDGLVKAIATLAKMPQRCPAAEEESEQIGINLRLWLQGRRPGVDRILFSIEGDNLTLR